MLLSKRKPHKKRSSTGCRTCRLRRIKCDEAPDACTNCVSTGRTCDGYEAHRLPRACGPQSKQLKRTVAVAHPALTQVAFGLQWAVTSDEGRCLSFFQHQSVQNMVGFYDSSLWHRLILRLSYTEPAVYHAAIALGAINNAQDKNKVLRPGQKLQSIWYWFGLEQAGRSISLLNKRHFSQDPQFQEVVLVCCLLFIACEMLCGNYDNACAHVQGGLQVLQKLNIRRKISGEFISPVDSCIVETFLQLQAQSVFYGTGVHFHVDNDLVSEHPYEDYLGTFQRLQDARRVCDPLLNTGWPFAARSWKLSEAEIMADYAMLHQEQLFLLSSMSRFLSRLDWLTRQSYSQLSEKEQRETDMTTVNCFALNFALKTSLLSRNTPLSPELAQESEDLVSLTESAIQKLREHPIITLDSPIVPALYNAAARTPNYSVRVKAIALMRVWQHVEGFANTALVADILEEGLKIALRKLRREMIATSRALPAGLMFIPATDGQTFVRIGYRMFGAEHEQWLSLEKSPALFDALPFIQSASQWSCLRSLGIVKSAGA
ncbi:Zn(II)2Cys6 transcription factor [Aspergillus brunneoviolaceus CBS 621.78]|uniref:C6 zinc finger domain protein n=1 Tax=Aspergillus brunneoviolaceus CBS 621.78 TaxID=1450534 RepID=A0ACD1G0I2_9EURO|nr:C6 zinc finger domain protein [Aspergillus brunneoviolaceus CBS 621.78]RAH42778.1 C6 zinc finger domain protein [Aspergillus brunneoviolaceus CBS 621.78]